MLKTEQGGQYSASAWNESQEGASALDIANTYQCLSPVQNLVYFSFITPKIICLQGQQLGLWL